MKKLLFPFMALAGLFLVTHIATKKRADPDYVAIKTDKLVEIQTSKDTPIPPIVDKINKKSASITGFLSDIEVRIDGCLVKTSGAIAYEKPKNFRMNIHSRFGKELDVGSNRDLFWFWSKRLDTPELHYANHADIKKSRLKTPLNPIWIMECLNFSGIDTKNAKYGQLENKITVLQDRLGAAGETVTVLTAIDPGQEKITGRYLYSESRLIAAAEVKSATLKGNNWVPEKMLVVWKDEGVTMEWNFSNQKINSGIDTKIWLMPESKKKIDMGK